MQIPKDAMLLRIFIGEDDKCGRQPLYEAIVFKVFDSEKDGRARFTPHTSFDDPSTPAGAAPRQSIEARTLAFF